MNELEGLSLDGARLYRDPEFYDMENLGEEEVLAYYGWDLAPAYISEGLTDGGNAPGGCLYREKATAARWSRTRRAGYYDIYVASFTLDGVEYEVEAQRLELEEVIKIVASIINIPYSRNFTVGNIMDGQS